MRNEKVRVTSLAAKRLLWLGHQRNQKFKHLEVGSRHIVYDGVLVKTSASSFELKTDLIPLPANVLAVNITSRDTGEFINGRAAHVRDVDIAKISRDVFYVGAGESVAQLNSTVAATIPEAFAFGEAMPDGTPSVVYSGFTGKLVEGYTTLRSDRPFDFLTTSSPTVGAPFVAPSDKFWVEVVINSGGGRFRRFTFSEAWLRLYAPGHDLISRAHRNRVTTHFVAACSNNRRLAITVPMTVGDPYDETTNNYSWGAYNALTLCIDMDGPEGPEVLWSDLWDRRSDGDNKTGPYQYWPTSPYDPLLYDRPPLSGANQNTVIDSLEMTEDGSVFGGRIITTAIKLPEPDPGNIDYTQGLYKLPIAGQVLKFVEWTPLGAYTEVLADQACEAGLYFYDKLVAETGLPTQVKNTVLTFLQAYNVQNTTSGANGVSAGAFYLPSEVGLGYTGDTRYLFASSLRVYRDGLNAASNPDSQLDTDLTGERLLVSSDSTKYAIVQNQAGVFSAVAWFSADTGFESVRSRNFLDIAGLPGLDAEALNYNYFHQNLRVPSAAFIGAGTFATPATNAAVTSEVSMLLAFMSAPTFYTKGIPGITNVNTSVGDESARVIQEELPSGASTIPSVLSLTDDSGAYISNDGGNNWIRVIESQRYSDLAYIGSEFLVRPFDKSKEVR